MKNEILCVLVFEDYSVACSIVNHDIYGTPEFEERKQKAIENKLPLKCVREFFLAI